MSVVIRINGTDITNDVIIADAEFTALVNGQAGQAHLRVRDDHQTYNFTTGKTLTLDIDSVRVWGGFVTAARKVFALPVVKTTNPTAVKRIWSITGADYNVLFDKRFLFKASDPAGKVFFSYATSTYDDTIINDVFDNYLDLSGDGLTRTGVQRIAHAILDVPGNTPSGAPASAGDSWNNFMRNIARATGGVYYISPDKDLFYVDVETVDSNYTLTDTPTGAFDLGYQNFELLENGSDLINDMLVWGAGTGSPNYVFSRTTDATSVSTHGRWQSALVTGGLFRQTSADTVGHSYVYGTPQSHRGGKDNAVRVTCRVFKPYFKAGQKVQVNIGIFGYSDVLPIRSMAIKFVNRTQAYFDLLLSHVIDLPVLIYETRFFNPANINITRPNIGIPPPPPPAASAPECICGITDTFDRADGPIGTSDSGIEWLIFNGAPRVFGNQGIIESAASTFGYSNMALDYFPDLATGPMQGTVEFEYQSAASVTAMLVTVSALGSIRLDVSAGEVTSFREGGTISDVAEPYGFAPPGTRLTLRFYEDLNVQRVKVWETASAEPGAWLIENYQAYEGGDLPVSASFGLLNNSSADSFIVDNLDIANVDRCTAAQFDGFQRTTSSPSWGTSTSGRVWTVTPPSPFISPVPWTASVANGIGQLHVDATTAGHGSDVSVRSDLIDVSALSWKATAHFRIGHITNATSPPFPTSIFIWLGGLYLSSSAITVSSGYPTGAYYAGYSGNVGTDHTFAWEQGAWYWLEFIHTDGVGHELRLWKSGDARPTVAMQTAVSTSPMDLAAAYVYIDTGAVGSPSEGQTLSFDYIDFDYAGKPCYPCDPVYVFWDALSSHPAAGTWNPMVPFGGAPVYTWTETGVHSTNGSTRGFIGPADSVSVPQEGREAILVAGPWDNEFEFNGAFEFPVGVSSNPADARAIFTLSVGGPYSASIGIGPITTGGLMVLWSGSGPAVIGTNAVQQARNWLNATLYSIKWHHARGTTGTDYVKVWVATDPEPSTWDLTLGTGGTPGFIGSSGSDPLFQIDVITKFAHVTDQWGWQGMYMTAPCGQRIPGSATTGPVTETFVATSGQLLILLGNAFQVYTAEVFINGIRQSPASYIESPNAGTVLLDAALTAGDDVVVRYYATGAIEI